MPQTAIKKELDAIANLAVLMRAKAAGMIIYPEDLLVNYAEIEDKLSLLEDQMIERGAAAIGVAVDSFLANIKSTDDVDPALFDLSSLDDIIFDHARGSWEYGQETAAEESLQLEIQSASEILRFAGGVPALTDLTNDDAFEWYRAYSRMLRDGAQDAVFMHMQPVILEHIEAGMTGRPLMEALSVDFRRFGSVRCGIIARTESNKAFNWGRRYRFDQSRAIAGYRYSAIMDERTTDICIGLHGHSWELGDPALEEYTPPNHYQCRSVIVPISKYVTFTFDPPAADWEKDLPAKEFEVLQKFKNSEWFPKRETVAKLVIPKRKPAAKKAAAPKPKKTPPAVDPAVPAPEVKPGLQEADVRAIEKIRGILDGIDPSDRRKMAKELLKRVGLEHIPVSIRQITDNGFVSINTKDGASITATEYVLKSQNARPEVYQTKTALHEFYHANFNGLDTDLWSPWFGNKRWIDLEETATEAASHWMLREIGITDVIAPSYADKLARNLPKIKRLDEFRHCETLEDFGEMFLKYRFDAENNTASWKWLEEKIQNVDLDPDEHKIQLDEWKKYVFDHEEEILAHLYDSYNHEDKLKREQVYRDHIKRSLHDGWDDYEDFMGPAFSQSVILAMNAIGWRKRDAD